MPVPRDAGLSSLIETEIIPRLLAAHSLPCCGPLAAETGSDVIDPTEVAGFAPLALQVEADELFHHVEAFRRRGVPVDTLFVDLLAPAARVLGEYWEQDRCDFLEVTIGLWRLQEVLNQLSERVPAIRASQGRTALFASLPGDQHCFGTVVVDEVFVREGWQTARMCEVAMPDLLARVAEDRFDLVGLTVTCDCHIARLPSVICALRSVSRNPRVRVMVGGRVFVADAGLALRVGADGTAPDAKRAVELAGVLLAEVKREVAC